VHSRASAPGFPPTFSDIKNRYHSNDPRDHCWDQIYERPECTCVEDSRELGVEKLIGLDDEYRKKSEGKTQNGVGYSKGDSPSTRAVSDEFHCDAGEKDHCQDRNQWTNRVKGFLVGGLPQKEQDQK